MGAPPTTNVGGRIGAPNLRRRLHLGGSRLEVASGAEMALGAARASELTQLITWTCGERGSRDCGSGDRVCGCRTYGQNLPYKASEG